MNMPLVSMNRRRRGGAAAFTPAGLFALAEPGVWYDPSDLTTLYQDTAGTTPVTTPGQTVALALDKSKGLVLGSNTASSDLTTWTKNATATTPTATTVNLPAANDYIHTGASTVAARAYEIKAVMSGSGTVTLAIYGNATGFASATPTVSLTPTPTEYTILRYFRDTDADRRVVIGRFGGATATSVTVASVSVREVSGFHATQATAASRPTYGIVPATGRRNLLTRTEEFGTSPWFKVGAQSVNSDAAVAPNGTTTAEKLIPSSASDLQAIYQGQTFSAVTYTASVYAKAAEYSWLFVRVDGVSNGYVFFNLSSGTIGTQDAGRTGSISSQGNGWYRCTVTWTSTGGTGNVLIGASNANATPVFAGNGTSGILIWGAQLETGSSATAYQRVGSAFDVTEAGVASLSYLFFGGDTAPADPRWMVTPTITPGVDKAQVFAGVRKLSDAASVIVEHSVSAGLNAGSFLLAHNGSGAPTGYNGISRGSATATEVGANGYSAPRNDVLSLLGDISGDLATLRVNGTQVAQSTADQGTGNYLAYPLYIGRRGGTTLAFNGNLFSLIVRFGANLDANTITNTETWVGGKTGIDIAKWVSPTIFARDETAILDRFNATIERRAV